VLLLFQSGQQGLVGELVKQGTVKEYTVQSTSTENEVLIKYLKISEERGI